MLLTPTCRDSGYFNLTIQNALHSPLDRLGRCAASLVIQPFKVRLVVDDVLQNTNVVLWTKRNEFKHGTNFLAWAFNIARYQVKHQHGRNKRDGTVEAMVEGAKKDVISLINWSNTGPSMSRVVKVAVTWQDCRGEFSEFGIRF